MKIGEAYKQSIHKMANKVIKSFNHTRNEKMQIKTIMTRHFISIVRTIFKSPIIPTVAKDMQQEEF